MGGHRATAHVRENEESSELTHPGYTSALRHPDVPAKVPGLPLWASNISIFLSTRGELLRWEPLEFSWSAHPSASGQVGVRHLFLDTPGEEVSQHLGDTTFLFCQHLIL